VFCQFPKVSKSFLLAAATLLFLAQDNIPVLAEEPLESVLQELAVYFPDFLDAPATDVALGSWAGVEPAVLTIWHLSPPISFLAIGSRLRSIPQEFRLKVA
jgi:hypothetical protein